MSYGERIIQNPWTAVVYVDFNLSTKQLDKTWNSAFKAAGLNNFDMVRKRGREII
jgi:hypothetical protein